MSIKTFFHNLFRVGKNKRVDFATTLNFEIPPHDECKKCGGFFKPGSLKTVAEINVIAGAKKGPSTQTRFSSFCDRCKPPSDLILNLVDGKSQYVIDYRHFIFNKYDIAEIFKDGDLVVSITLEESRATWCTSCGDTTAPGLCADCKKRGKKKSV